jgi:hypothetical protein
MIFRLYQYLKINQPCIDIGTVKPGTPSLGNKGEMGKRPKIQVLLSKSYLSKRIQIETQLMKTNVQYTKLKK